MFKAGELIRYGNTGVCKVTEIKEIDDSKKGKRKFYVLEPLYQKCIISTPVDNKKVFMRPIISKEKAEELIDEIPMIEAEEYHSPVMRELTEHYEASFKSHSCEDLIELTLSIYTKKQTMAEQKKKIGIIDERYLKRGEELLFGEFAAALDIPRERVQSYIEERVEKKKK